MKREIDGNVYNTGDATVIASHETGSTHVHRMISLYRSRDGRYFIVEEREIHGVDGALLTPLTETMARDWLEKHGKAELARSLFKNGRIFLTIEVDSGVFRRIAAAAEAAGVSEQAWVLNAIHAALADGAAASPVGPHTHVLPDLLKTRRSHSANTPIPDGWVAAVNLHPAHPAFTRLGNPKPFVAGAHAAFQALLRAYGPPNILAEKERIAHAVLAAAGPHEYPAASTRAARTAVRVALRQMFHTHPDTTNLGRWLAVFDHGAANATDAADVHA